MICLKSACLIPLTQKGTARSGVEKWWIVFKKNKKKSLQQQHDEKTTDLCSLHFETAVTAMGRILSTLRLVCWPQPEECVVRRASSTELYVDNTTVSYVQTSSL